jgi:hypothetical protein
MTSSSEIEVTRSRRRVRGLERGVVVVDATFLKDLKRPESTARIESALRVAHLRIAPSVANVLEALKHSHPGIRRELIDGLRRWVGNRPLNPWPLDLLRLAGEALPLTEFTIGAANIDRLIDHPEELQADHDKAAAFLNSLQTKWAASYAENRPLFQATLKAMGSKYAWRDIPSFLASPDWASQDVQQHLAGTLWELAELPGTAPSLAVVHRSEIWRLAMDIFGAATFTHAIVPDKLAKPPGFIDLMQLLYLTEHTRARIFVTDDGLLYTAATQILRGRYPNVRVLTGAEFLGAAV